MDAAKILNDDSALASALLSDLPALSAGMHGHVFEKKNCSYLPTYLPT